jgi:hypothetical protein
MGIREYIMALPNPWHEFSSPCAFSEGLFEASKLAEARERELLDRQAQMIAEIELKISFDDNGCEYIGGAELREIFDKYEALE